MIDEKILKQLYPLKEKKLRRILLESPITTMPIVTQSDVDQGFIKRYFVRAANDTSFMTEIDKKQFESLKNNPRFVTVMINWKIVGKKKTEYTPAGNPIYGVADMNRITVANADLTFGGLQTYIRNYEEYWVKEYPR